MKSDKVEQKIKDLNEIRGIYQRDFQEIKKRYDEGDVSEAYFLKKKMKYEKKLDKIKDKIHKLELQGS